MQLESKLKSVLDENAVLSKAKVDAENPGPESRTGQPVASSVDYGNPFPIRQQGPKHFSGGL